MQQSLVHDIINTNGWWLKVEFRIHVLDINNMVQEKINSQTENYKIIPNSRSKELQRIDLSEPLLELCYSTPLKIAYNNSDDHNQVVWIYQQSSIQQSHVLVWPRLTLQNISGEKSIFDNLFFGTGAL